MGKTKLYLAILALFFQSCAVEQGNIIEEDVPDVAQADVSSYLSGDVLETDSREPPVCECVSDLDCGDHFRGQGPCQRAACNPENCSCVIQQAFEGEPCDDGDKCTLTDLCESGACLGGELQVCVDGNDCTDDTCDSQKGCVFQFITAPCDDGNPCTSENTCEEGVCGKGVPTPCDDGNTCTLNGCSPAVGCTFDAIGGSCDDGDACTVQDSCESTICSGLPRDCDDGNNCTADSCETDCIHEAIDNLCDDGIFCTFGDFCSEGNCIGGSLTPCNDGNLCTEDLCKDESCESIPLACDDGDSCTLNYCDPVSGCKSSPVVCDEGTDCLESKCVAELGCTDIPRVAVCDDGDPCTLLDPCIDGLCSPGELQNCDDGEPCTTDTCLPDTGCMHVNLEDGTGCIDENPCTLLEQCMNGVCAGGTWLQCDDGNPCTDDWCDASLGCQTSNNEQECDDGLMCTEWSQCSGGTCEFGVSKLCDDGEDCTEDFCIEGLGCVVSLLTGESCDDGLSCNGSDSCLAGACTSVPCFCTEDADCEGESPCQGQGSCVQGVCLFTDEVICESENPCSPESCAPETGECVMTPLPDGTLCSDGELCTSGDSCVGGLCLGKSIQCDDDNPCTADECIDGNCNFTPLTNTSCPFGNCVDGGNCSAGSCLPGNLECETACGVEEPLSCGEMIRFAELTGSGLLDDAPCAAGYFPGPERIFTIVAEDIKNGDAVVIFKGHEAGVALFITTEGDDSCTYQSCSIHTEGESSLSVKPGTKIQLRVDSAFLSGGEFSLGLLCEDQIPPVNCEGSMETGCPKCSCNECVCNIMESCCSDVWTSECSTICQESCGGCDVPQPCVYQEGPAIAEGSECASCVCALDVMCCSVQWDGFCTAMARADCDDSCNCLDFVGSCCEAKASPGCDDGGCSLCVCSESPECCELAWDESCVEESFSRCVEDCACANPDTTCCSPHNTAGCEDASCEGCVCDQAPHCCEVAWDGECVNLVKAGLCDSKCPCN